MLKQNPKGQTHFRFIWQTFHIFIAKH